MGSLLAALGFFFMPLVILKAGSISFNYAEINLLAVQDDFRFLLLFALSLAPFGVAFQSDVYRRGWLLVGLGTLIMVITLWLPTVVAEEFLANADSILGVTARGPRFQPAGAMITGLVGGYIVVFAGTRDLQDQDVPGYIVTAASLVGLGIIIFLLSNGTMDSYSILVELRISGETLPDQFLLHMAYVVVTLSVGLVVGIALGFWASRDERVAPVILYIVGIIQTIPSLALFGLLLVPLADLGQANLEQAIMDFGLITIVSVVLMGLLIVAMPRLPESLRIVPTTLAAVIGTIPLALFLLVAISFLFRVTFVMIRTGDVNNLRLLTAGLVVLALVLVNIHNLVRIRPERERLLFWAQRISAVLALGTFGLLFYESTRQFLPSDPFSEWQLNDLGLRGIGPTPALVALSLYSLLPLVRNTYAGLNNIDLAIIDSGRGMGMTPRQIFFRIELPLALPIIMAGVRNAAISLVGIAAIATVVGGRGLGDFIITGIQPIQLDLILLGAIPAIFMAILFEFLLRVIENIITSPGIRHV